MGDRRVGGAGRVGAVLAVALGVVGAWAFIGNALLGGCRPEPPRALPNGEPPGLGVEGVWGGAKEVVWGTGADQVRQIVGLNYAGSVDTLKMAETAVRGAPAVLFRFTEGSTDPGLVIGWEDSCSLMVLLPQEMTEAEALDFASRY
jgi:hypothetical protein